MLAGTHLTNFWRDLKYRVSDEDVGKLGYALTTLRKADRTNQKNAITNFANDASLKALCQNLYNNILGEPIIIDNFNGDDNGDMLRNASRLMNYIKNLTTEGEPIQRMIDGLYRYAQEFEMDDETNKEGQGSGTDGTMDKEGQKLAGKEIIKNGVEKEEERQRREKHRNNHVAPEQIIGWLKKIIGIEDKKKMSTIEKMSQLSKISATEFVKPRPLLLKKLVNHELLVRRRTMPSKKFLHIIHDCSGSMERYDDTTFKILDFLKAACAENNIETDYMGFRETIFGTSLSIQKDMKFIKRIRRTGGTKIQQSHWDRICKLQKTKEKQYLLVISDGDDSYSPNGSEAIMSTERDKNIESAILIYENCNTGNFPEENIYICSKQRQVNFE